MKPAILRWSLALAALALFGLIVAPVRAAISRPTASPVFINTWLVLGTFSNTGTYYDAGLEHPWINESHVAPQAGASAAGHTWRYFDDRLFSRNYDNYQDLFSYFHIERHESVAGVVAYAHVYLYTPRPQAAQLCLAADWSAKVWLNGQMITRFIDGSGKRQANVTNIQLQKGWNSLLLKIANTENGRFGFYARVCARNGGNLPDLIISPNGPGQGALRIATQAMANLNLQPLGLTQPPTMPIGWRGWSYVGAHPDPDNPVFNPFYEGPGAMGSFFTGRDQCDDMMEASNFQFTAQGGTPPYTWLLGDGRFPPGLTLHSDGTITGTILPAAQVGDYHFTVWVMDSQGQLTSKNFSITVRPRPNKWYEEARLVANIHMDWVPPAELPDFAKLLKRMGYQVVMATSYNNGDRRFHYPSTFSQRQVKYDAIAATKAALEKERIKLGMYFGNITNLPGSPFSDNQALLVLLEAVRRYHPAVLWFDWAGINALAPDAMYSAVRTLDPNLVIVYNGDVRGGNGGDWDEICFEGFGAWGKGQAWSIWPQPFPWPLKNSPESWRLMIDNPHWHADPGILSSWRQMLRIEMSLIGQGFEGNICDLGWEHNVYHPVPPHQMLLNDIPWKIADWTSPPGLPSRAPAFTWVNPGPLAPASWGYDVINLKRNTIYLHILKNPFGKAGLPTDPTLTVRPITENVKDVVWMNTNRPLKFTQHLTQTDHSVTIDITGVKQDPVDTIIRIDLAQPLPPPSLPLALRRGPIPPGNLACFRPAELRDETGAQQAPPMSSLRYASNGVDGNLNTYAAAPYHWNWTYQVDLQRLRRIGRIVVIFQPHNFATKYDILLSLDGRRWQRVAQVVTDHGGEHVTMIKPTLGRYVRVQAIKPDGPNQPGIHMNIEELQVFAPGRI